MKTTRIFIFTLLVGLFLLFANGCEKVEGDGINGNNMSIPTLSTTEITNITQTSANSGGSITSDGGSDVTARGVCWSTNQTPTISDNITTDGTGVGMFSSILTDLSPNTTYYVRAYATNSKGTGYGNTLTFTTQEQDENSFTDPRDGNVYKFVTIGEQIWMAENLKYLPNVVGPETWSETEPYYYVYDYEGTDVTAAKVTANYNTYGVLYNWIAAVDGTTGSETNPSGIQGICPAGWHLPSDAEWTQLIDYLGGDWIAGDKLKEAGTTHWESPNEGATNESGFTALPGGYYVNGFGAIGRFGNWWSATEDPTTNSAWYRDMRCFESSVYRSNVDRSWGMSVRCIKD
ncbi:MAG: FISUMP domain-containing protein [Salinivirgaceae bacterium]|jgi:uncharacterized protein (TIGR02145 family)